MSRIVGLIFMVYLPSCVLAQEKVDTVHYLDSHLSSIDSIDIIGTEANSTFDGGVSFQGKSIGDFNDFRNRIIGHGITKEDFRNNNMVFSGLPYLGFQVNFGSESRLNVGLLYSQAFNDSLLFNIRYNRNSANGYLRNSAYSRSEFNAGLKLTGDVYSLNFNGGFISNSFLHSGGLRDTLNDDFGLVFQPILKNQASSEYRKSSISINQYFDFLTSSDRGLGLILTSDFDIDNRKYNEIDSVDAIYGNAYINADTTADQYNLTRLKQGAGLFINSLVQGEIVMSIAKRHYLNLNNISDSIELNLKGKFYYQSNKLYTSLETDYNLAGNNNEWNILSKIDYRPNKWKVLGRFELASMAPEFYQRSYSSNNYLVSNSTFNNIDIQSIDLNFSRTIIDSSQFVGIKLSYLGIQNNLLFDGDTWSDQVMNSFNASSVQIFGKLNFGSFNIHPRIQYSLVKDKIIPAWNIATRLFVKGKVFKDKKLSAMTGVDLSYQSQMQQWSFNSVLDAYQFSTSSLLLNPNRTNIDYFANFGIQHFNFFVRMENIGYFWTKHNIQYVQNYPLESWRLRIGITWEFFN